MLCNKLLVMKRFSSGIRNHRLTIKCFMTLTYDAYRWYLHVNYLWSYAIYGLLDFPFETRRRICITSAESIVRIRELPEWIMAISRNRCIIHNRLNTISLNTDCRLTVIHAAKTQNIWSYTRYRALLHLCLKSISILFQKHYQHLKMLNAISVVSLGHNAFVVAQWLCCMTVKIWEWISNFIPRFKMG